MSLAINKLETVRINEPLVNINEKLYWGILKGGVRSSYKVLSSTTFDNSSATWSAPPPNPNTFVDRRVFLKVPVTISFTGTATSGNLLQAGYDAFRDHPLASVMNTVDMTLNNQSFSANISDYIKALRMYHDGCKKLNIRELSMTPSYPDQSQDYADLVGYTRNPLGTFGDSLSNSEIPRGSFPVVVNNTSSTATVSANITEELFLSPLIFGNSKEQPGFIHLQTFQLTINWSTSLSYMWSHASNPNVTISTVSVSLGQPQLLFRYVTPLSTQIIPRHVEYDFIEIQRYPTTGTALASGASATISSSNIQLNTIPRMIYIFARKQNSDLSYTDTDSFMAINSISLQWENQSGLFAECNQELLYNIARKNGVNRSYIEWIGGDFPLYNLAGSIKGIGSVLALELGTDIGLKELEAPGMIGTYQLQMNVNITNPHPTDTITPTLYVVVSNEGLLTFEDNSAIRQIGIISQSDVLNAKEMMGIDYNDLTYMSGAGNIFHDFKRILTNIVSKVKPFIKQALPYAKKGIELAERFVGDGANVGGACAGAYAGAYGDGYFGKVTKDEEGIIDGCVDPSRYYLKPIIRRGKQQLVCVPIKNEKKVRKCANVKPKKCSKNKNLVCVRSKLGKEFYRCQPKKYKKGSAMVGGELIDRYELEKRLMQ